MKIVLIKVPMEQVVIDVKSFLLVNVFEKIVWIVQKYLQNKGIVIIVHIIWEHFVIQNVETEYVLKMRLVNSVLKIVGNSVIHVEIELSKAMNNVMKEKLTIFLVVPSLILMMFSPF